MGEHKHSKVKGFLNFWLEVHTVPKIWEKWISMVRKSMRKHKYFKLKGFLNILRKAEIHTIPKMWEKWIPITQEKYGKKQTFQSSGFFKFYIWSRNSWSSQNIGKVDFHSTRKAWENKYVKFMGSLNISGGAEIHIIPKTWETWIHIIREKYVKKQTFESYGFLKYFGWSRNPYSSKNIEKVDYHSTGKVWQNTSISNLWIS